MSTFEYCCYGTFKVAQVVATVDWQRCLSASAVHMRMRLPANLAMILYFPSPPVTVSLFFLSVSSGSQLYGLYLITLLSIVLWIVIVPACVRFSLVKQRCQNKKLRTLLLVLGTV